GARCSIESWRVCPDTLAWSRPDSERAQSATSPRQASHSARWWSTQSSASSVSPPVTKLKIVFSARQLMRSRVEFYTPSHRIKGVSPRPESAVLSSQLLESARQAWPEIDIDVGEFSRYVAERTGRGDAAAINISDLYLACACVRGDDRALRALDALIVRDV